MTEQIEFEYIHGGGGGGGGSRINPNTGSLMSLPGSSMLVHLSASVADAEKSNKSVLLSLVSTAFIYVATWTFGALSVAQPFSGHAHQEVIFGTMYSLASVSLGVFVLVYYVISRSDVQHCFAALTTFVKNRGTIITL